MVLNGLGFANRRLYLTPHFCANKPTEHFLGAGVTLEVLNDDTLVKALDALHDYGVSELYSLIAARAVTRLKLKPKVGHQDITSFHVDGEYDSDYAPNPDEGVVHITRGYSRDGKPELNQVALELIHEHQASLPVAMQVLDGNQNDNKTMRSSVSTHTKQLRQVGIGVLVKDGAGYSEGALKAHEEAILTWVMRVPATLTEVKALLETTDVTTMRPLAETYGYASVKSSYAGVLQSWLVIYSQAAQARTKKSVSKQLLKTTEQERKAFEKLCRLEFAYPQDAERAFEAFRGSPNVLTVHDTQVIEKVHHAKRGRPSQDSIRERISYYLQGALAAPITYYQTHLVRASLFILATNELDLEILTNEEILTTYKAQSKVERRFRFLKDPMFLAAILFLKKVQRVMALLMVMTVCLLVYAALEHRIRAALSAPHNYVPDQKGKPTHRPTARWMFELFLDVYLLPIIQDGTQASTINLKDELKGLLELLGSSYQQTYP